MEVNPTDLEIPKLRFKQYLYNIGTFSLYHYDILRSLRTHFSMILHFLTFRCREFRTVGVNRISLGVQALNDRDLGILGRQHSVKETLRY